MVYLYCDWCEQHSRGHYNTSTGHGKPDAYEVLQVPTECHEQALKGNLKVQTTIQKTTTTFFYLGYCGQCGYPNHVAILDSIVNIDPQVRRHVRGLKAKHDCMQMKARNLLIKQPYQVPKTVQSSKGEMQREPSNQCQPAIYLLGR